MIVRAILTEGRIQPMDPIPEDWADGCELRVESAALPERDEDTCDWYEEMQRLAALISPEDDEALRVAVQEIRREAKAEAEPKLEL